MKTLKNHTGLYSDFYELTMAQGYFYAGKGQDKATFDYFFRNNPFKGGYAVFAGLHELLELIENFSYSAEDLTYLAEQGLKKEFLEYLENFKFSGSIWSVQEGEIVFPNEPTFIVEGNLIETQIIETLILNFLNFQTLIATKARRIRTVAEDCFFADFGLRRAQSLGGIHASRAAYIGGADATSNTYAGKIFDIPVSGTQAHAWVQSFESELMAFRKYAEITPAHTVLLVDTYDTLKSGIPNAIIVGKELKAKGYQLKGVRLDSGDLAYLSQKARIMLDEAGLKEVEIYASNQLNEYVIKSLNEQGARLDGYGVGTELITGKDDGALGGVYKLVSSNGKPRLKISENVEKISLPGEKKLVRYYDEKGFFFRDGILLKSEEQVETLYHPHHYYKYTPVKDLQMEVLTVPVMKEGQIISAKPSLSEIKAYSLKRFEQLEAAHKRFISPHIYKVGVSMSIIELRDEMIKNAQKHFH